MPEHPLVCFGAEASVVGVVAAAGNVSVDPTDHARTRDTVRRRCPRALGRDIVARTSRSRGAQVELSRQATARGELQVHLARILSDRAGPGGAFVDRAVAAIEAAGAAERPGVVVAVDIAIKFEAVGSCRGKRESGSEYDCRSGRKELFEHPNSPVVWVFDTATHVTAARV